ncbi:MAG: 4-(cytidine 5'-diphospho)-2-C-methyl-D-erythritol kinase [Caldimicrobium sp.]
MSTYSLLSPAKLNLVLQVLRRRKDGFHDIYGIFQKITLFDELEIVRPKRSFELIFICEESIPVKENILYKTWRLFKETFQIKEEIAIKVKKRIPLGAGLGGGSSNAGTFLRALSKIYEIPEERVLELSKKIGADVPFFVSPFFSSEVEGIGDILKPFPNFRAFYLLIYPGFKIETGWAYKALNLTMEKDPVKYEPSLSPWETSQGLINDFKALLYNKYPIYQRYESLLMKEGAKAINITGTGSTIYGVFDNPPLLSFVRLKKFLNGAKIYLAKNLDGEDQ